MHEIDIELFFIHYARLLAESYDIDVSDFSMYGAHRIVLTTSEGTALILFEEETLPVCVYHPRKQDRPGFLLASIACLRVMDVLGRSEWLISGEVEGHTSITRFRKLAVAPNPPLPIFSFGEEELDIELERRMGTEYGKGTPEWAFLYMTLQKCCFMKQHLIPPNHFVPTTYQLMFVYTDPDNKDTVSLTSVGDTLGQITINSRIDGIDYDVLGFPLRLISALLRQSFFSVDYVPLHRYVLMVNPEEAGSESM